MEERENGEGSRRDFDDEVYMGESVSAEELISRARARAEGRNEIIVLTDDDDSTFSTRDRCKDRKVTRSIVRFAAPSAAFTQLQGSLRRREDEDDDTSIVAPGVTPAAVTDENSNAVVVLQSLEGGVHISTNITVLPMKSAANGAVAEVAPGNVKKTATPITTTLATEPMKPMVGQPKALSASNKRKHDDTSQSVISGYFQSSRPAQPPPAARYMPQLPSRYIPPLNNNDHYYHQPLANYPPNCIVPCYCAQCHPTSYEYNRHRR